MGDLSDRFGALMARMSKGDAELFRTVFDSPSFLARFN
jgi:hypothetical protein